MKPLFDLFEENESQIFFFFLTVRDLPFKIIQLNAFSL